MKKEVSVVFINDELENEFLNLPEDDLLKKRIKYVIERIKYNPTFGRPITKRLIPKEYKNQGVDNAFWVELSKGRGWRLIYSLTPKGEAEIIAIILEWFTRHKDYERKFRY
jgi:hypothetical protein